MYSRPFRRISFFAVLILFILACSPALFVPTKKNSVKAGVPLEQLHLARKLYVKHCGSCHSLYLPKQYNAKEWDGILHDMQDEAGISDEEKAIILKYLTSQ